MIAGIEEQGMLYALIPAALSIGLLFWWRSVMLFKRTVEDVPTSKVKGVFIGLNEVKGEVKSYDPLETYLTESPSVWYTWSIKEHWRRTETYTDSKGRSHTRTVSGWRTVDSGSSYQSFFLVDDTGELLIDPKGAKVDAPSTLSHYCGTSDSLYYGKGPSGSIMNSTYRRRFTEYALAPGDNLYVLGPAKLRDEVVAPMIAHNKLARYYFISSRSESQIVRGKSFWSIFLMIFATLAALAVPVVAICFRERIEPLEVFVQYPGWVALAAAIFSLVVGLFYLMLLYNGLVRVRNRLRLALSLIEVQLKRRHDLIPQLLECVKATASHERELHTMVVEARSESMQWGSVGKDVGQEIGKDQGVVGQLFALSEAYPDLKVDANFKLFMEQLTDTEDRIALARAFYNDSLLALQDRLLTFPDVLVAKWFRFQSGNLLQPINDPSEREAPRVSFGEGKS
ncbi:MAG: LemA family protein [Opitutales bacterium]